MKKQNRKNQISDFKYSIDIDKEIQKVNEDLNSILKKFKL